MRKKVLVAMSGGVDSTVAAFLLKQEGYEVAGATLQVWMSPQCEARNTRACCSVQGIEDARTSAHALGIDHIVLDCQKEFEREVVQYFKEEYVAGRTPNPCIRCNDRIKFRFFLDRALEMGIDTIATGHYARIERNDTTEEYQLREGLDSAKDQSYVLFGLTQEIMARTLFPLGSWTKQEVRELARQQGLAVSDKPDSQEICFIPGLDYPHFLEREYGLAPRQGAIRARTGEILGCHNGYFHFTVGQRKRLGIAAPRPMYVLEIRPGENEVIVGSREDVFQKSFRASTIHWINGQPKTNPFEAHVKIRSVHRKAKAALTIQNGGTVCGEFDEPQEAITPGQAAVFYEVDRVLGGGWLS